MKPFTQFRLLAALTLLASLVLVGCGESESTTGSTAGGTNEPVEATLPGGLFLAAAPDGVRPIADLKTTAKEGDTVVVQAYVGGVMSPMVEGRAVASVVDAGVYNKCTSEDDHCKTPWDYCCADPEQVKMNMATVQVVTPEGRVLPASLSPRVEPLSKLVVQGVVGPRVDDAVLTINATGIYVEPTE